MAEKGFLELRCRDIMSEYEHRNASDAVRSVCVDLVNKFGKINREFDEEPFLDLPAVEWSKDGKELLAIHLKDNRREKITEEFLEEYPETIKYSFVGFADVVYYPKEDELNKGQLMTIARIDLWGGLDATTRAYDYRGELLSTDELLSLENDLKRYRILAEDGRFEPNSPVAGQAGLADQS